MAIIIPSQPCEFATRSTRIGTPPRSVSRSTDAIRSRLLFKLGIHGPHSGSMMHHKKMRCSADDKRKKAGGCTAKKAATSSRSCLVPLKFGRDPQASKDGCDDCNIPHLIPITSDLSIEPPLSIDGSSINSSSTKSTSRSGIQFDPSVTVIPVPSHRSYSQRMHAQLYTPRKTMASDTMRNTREFIHEGWDWQKVIEEDGMYTCKTSGELVHPAHVSVKSLMVNPYR